MTPIESERLIMREFHAPDQAPLLEILSDPRVMEFSVNGPMDAAGVASFVQSCQASYRTNGFGQWAVVERAAGRLIGFCGLAPLEIEGRQEVELGYRLARDCWGKGLATEAGSAVLEAGFSRWQLPSVIAIIAEGHTASLNVARKLGLTFDYATHYQGWDVGVHRRASASDS